jgi:hypothetical protein
MISVRKTGPMLGLMCLLFGTAAFYGCSGKSQTEASEKTASPTREHVYNGLYSVQIPEYMTATTELNGEAGTQFMNASREAYMIIIDEPKDEFVAAFKEVGEYVEEESVLSNYAVVQRGSFDGVISKPTRNTDISYTTSNGLSIGQSILEGPSVDIPYDIHYHFAYIEGKSSLYFVVCWTLMDKVGENAPDFENIIASFKEL